MIDIAPDIDEILEVSTEDRMIDAWLLREYLRLAIRMRHHHLLLGSTIGIRCEIGIACLLIIAIDTLHNKMVIHNLSQKLAIQIIEIEVVIAIPFTGKQDVVISQLDILQHLFLDIFISLILNSQLTDSRERICHIDT